jgi:peptidoglycan hydrolase CwlO-like protein
MSIELRRNPDTGDVERKVVSYEKVELAQLEAGVNDVQVRLTANTEELTQARALVADLEGKQSSLESELSDRKSELEAYQSVVGVTESESETEGVGSEESEGSETTESVEVPVTVTSPADEY